MNTAMIARIADHLFWFGRYIERVDSTARLLYVTRNLVLDADLPPGEVWRPVLEAVGEDEAFLARFSAGAMADGEAVERYLTWDDQNFVSIVQSVRFARENAWSIRSTVSLEVWQATNELYLGLLDPEARARFETRRHDFYRQIQRSTQLVYGLTQSTMLHDQALDLVWLGVLLERAGQVARTLDVHHERLAKGDPAEAAVMWLAVLRACSAFEPFAKRRPGQTTGPGVADFLLFEPDFPRAVRFALTEAHAALARLVPTELPDLPAHQSRARLAALCGWLDAQKPLSNEGLHEVLTHVVDETTALGQDLGRELLS